MGLKDVIGHDRAIKILKHAIKKERIPTTYIFAGEHGIGKKFTAINFIKTLNCIKRNKINLDDLDLNNIDACDDCPSCKKIDKGIHPDFLLIKPVNNQIRIEEIRAIEEFLSLRPFEGYYKAVLVDESEKMNQYSANAFLKTLEEPPLNNLIILISSNPENLPETILSRCSRINFKPLSSENFKRLLKNLLLQYPEIYKGKERGKTLFSKEEFHVLEGISSGRPGFIIEKDVIEERRWFLKLLKEMLNNGKDGWVSREDMEKWFNYMLIFLRDIAIVKLDGMQDYIINADMKDFLLKISKKVDLQTIINSFLRLSVLYRYLSFNLNKSLTWNYTCSYLRGFLEITNG